ncbi:Uncharacterised protein [Salmonella enterica subsp. salamae]|uniref:Uncharacterized protein n=1 Tax=Salmonella enterica subsp. salamae TaxID=59202 RepID=A0A6D2GCA8_SALER|nr:Uncharacterised protein [Salmonella enterica subsp. salamae]
MIVHDMAVILATLKAGRQPFNMALRRTALPDGQYRRLLQQIAGVKPDITAGNVNIERKQRRVGLDKMKTDHRKSFCILPVNVNSKAGSCLWHNSVLNKASI